MNCIDEDAARKTEGICERMEGFRSRPYLCPARVWTQGFGATYHLDGVPVKPTDPPISREEARVVLRHMVRGTYQPGTWALAPGLATNPLAAATDFSFNLGLTRFKQSTFRKRLIAGDLEGAAVEVRKWTRGGGRVLPGLVIRAELRAALLRKGE